MELLFIAIIIIVFVLIRKSCAPVAHFAITGAMVNLGYSKNYAKELHYYMDDGFTVHRGLNKKWALLLHGQVHWFHEFVDARDYVSREKVKDPNMSITQVNVMFHKGEITTVNCILWDGINCELVHIATVF